MPPIYFATTNPEKLKIAEIICTDHDIELKPVSVGDIPEIQGEDIAPIIEHKAKEAFRALGKPVVVSDDGWEFPALNGFPGAYMKSINYWFTSVDFLRLMDGITDRRANIHEHLAYFDGTNYAAFSNIIPGQILTEVRGSHTKAPCMNVVSLDIDNGLSITEVFESGIADSPERYKNRGSAWYDLLAWYKEKNT